MNERALRHGGTPFLEVRNRLVANPGTAPNRTMVGPDFLANDVTAAVGVGAAVIYRRGRSVAVAVAVVIRTVLRAEQRAYRQAAHGGANDCAIVTCLCRRGSGNRSSCNHPRSRKNGKSFHHDDTSE